MSRGQVYRHIDDRKRNCRQQKCPPQVRGTFCLLFVAVWTKSKAPVGARPDGFAPLLFSFSAPAGKVLTQKNPRPKRRGFFCSATGRIGSGYLFEDLILVVEVEEF